jgi:3-keto-disaccharide hydrolase
MKYALTLTLTLATTFVTFPAQDDPTPIVRGTDPAQFELIGLGADSISIVDGEVRLTGMPLGYFATKQEYRNYALNFEWKYDRPEGLKSDADFRGNSGLLVHLAKPHKVWPTCIQVQLAQADPGSIFAMGEARFQGTVDSEAQEKAIRPVGQWNRTEVTCRAGTISCVLNGVEVAQGEGASPDRGSIGWQSEGRPIRFREMKIRPLP